MKIHLRQSLVASLWLLLFAALGGAAMVGLASLLLHHRLQPVFIPRMATTGAVPGVLAWLIALCFAALPGARRAPGRPARFGLAQGLWAMAGTLLMMLTGAILPYMAAVYLMLTRILEHLPAQMPSRHDAKLLLASLLCSELLAALWLIWYCRRQGPAVLAGGTPAEIGWRAAPPRGHGMAVLLAAAVILLAALEFRLFPPDLSQLHNLGLEQLFRGPPGIAFAAALVVVFLAPPLEELLFRGIGFAGIAARLGPGWAVVITTAIFTVAHAPEKLHYLPGFADVAAVALAACWLRLRYRSIRPGMLLHFLYNFGMLAVPALTHGH